jgi:hypothetical protein
MHLRRWSKAPTFVTASVALLGIAGVVVAEETALPPEAPILLVPKVEVVFESSPRLELNIAGRGSRGAKNRSEVKFRVKGNVNATIAAEPAGRNPFVSIPSAGRCLGRAVGVDPSNRKESIGYALTLKWPADGRKAQTVGMDTDCPGGSTPAIKVPLFGKTRTGVLAIESRAEWNEKGAIVPPPGKYVGSIMLTVTAD